MSSWFRTYGYADVLDGFFIGAYPLDQSDVRLLELMRIERILNLVQDSEYRRGEREKVEEALARAGITEYRLTLVDYGGLEPHALERAVTELSAWLDEGIRTYLHCRAGWQRSAAVAAGVIAAREGIDVDDALERVRERKPTALPLPHQVEDLRRWWIGRTAAIPPPAGGE